MYYLVEITTTDKPNAAVYKYDTLEAAKANYHTKIGNQMKSAACKDELCVIIDSNGAVHVSDHYEKPIEPAAE